MQTFTYTFTVNAPTSAVSNFHHDTSVLKRLNPPGIVVQLHRVDPMGEGSISEFTLWMGPIPIRWRAVHSNVSENGFTDTQERGPLEFWVHTHHFEALNEDETSIHEKIEYRHPKGLRGLFTRVLFGRLGLLALFTYRKFSTRFALRSTK